ncbi:MAG: hypothetical protein ACRYF0_07700 [Janthinobacterium lividum]
MATSPALPPLSQAPNPGLAGYVAAYYLPQADLAADLVLASPGLVAADLQLLPGAGWRALPHTQGTLKFEETPKLERGVTTYQVRATAQRPQASPAVLAALASLDRRPLLLLLVEATGGRRLVGSREEYVLLSTTGEGQNPATRAGVELRFEGAAARRAPYYTGAVPVLSGPALAPPAGTGGYVEIRDRKGLLMARVAAGTTVTITSAFKVTLSF